MAVTDDFTTSELDLNGFVSISSPTALVWGPDGRLYVTQQTGEIYVLDVTFGDNPAVAGTDSGFYVTGAETVNDVKNIPNQNDNGTNAPSEDTRQVTGIDVTQQFDAGGNPVTINGEPAVVMYVTSSDNRIGAGDDGEDKGLDTNSGVITRLTQTPTGWDVVDIVRGLPRSEENHATNGLEVIQELDGSGNLVSERLIVASGGNANSGAPSNNFAGQQETPLSGALLEVDLDEINALSVLDDNGRAYVYDIPTLDDPTRGANEAGQDPFGGNDGLNSGKLLDGGPVQIYSAGYRNPYDVEVTDDGRVFTYDNGANNVWGGRPAGEDQNGDNLAFNDGPGTPTGYIATNLFVEDNNEQQPGGTVNFNPQNWDQLHEATRSDDLDGRTLSSGLGGAQTYSWEHPDFAQPLTLVYGGHPNPTRAEGARAGLLYTPEGGVGNAKLMVSNVDKGAGTSDFLEVVAWLQTIGYSEAFINATVVAVDPGVLYEDTFAGGFGGAGANGRPTTTGVFSLVENASGPIGVPSDINDIVETLNPVEGDYLEAGFTDGALDTGKGSINGLTEYTSSIFDDAGQTGMQGALIAAALNQTQLLVIGRNASGVVETTSTTVGNFQGSNDAKNTPRTVASEKEFIASGGAPLGLASIGDDLSELGNQTAFRGTIWASIFKQNGPVIEIYQPGNPTDNALLGAVNYAGQDASDVTDNDLDGVDHFNDPFEFDDDNGVSLSAGEEIKLTFAQTDLSQFPEFSGTIGDTGLMGAALDGVTPNRDAQTEADGVTNPDDLVDGLFDNGGNLIPGGNAPILQIKAVQDGTAIGAANTLRDALHTGVKLTNDVVSVVAETDIANWWESQAGDGRVSGISFGDGTQDNFVRFVWGDVNNNDVLGLEVGIEVNNTYTVLGSITDPAFTSALTGQANEEARVTLQLEIADIGGDYEILANYKIKGDATFKSVNLNGATLPAGSLQDVLDGTHTISDGDTTQNSGAAFGFMAEKPDGVSFQAVDFDELRINAFGDPAAGSSILYRVNAGNSDVVAIDGGPNWIGDVAFEGLTTGNITFDGTDGAVFANVLTDEAADVEFANGAVSADAAVAPAGLFFEERTKGGDLSYNFAVDAGKDYIVTVYYSENFNNIFTADPRVIDVEIEGGVPAAFDDINPLREAVDTVDGVGAPIPALANGNLEEKNPYLGRASQREATYTATDSVLTLTFAKGGDGTGNQPKVNAIQIVEVGGTTGGPDVVVPVITNIEVEDSTSDQDSPRLVTVTATDETGFDPADFTALDGSELTFTGLLPASVSAPQVTFAGNNTVATLVYTITPPAASGAWPDGNFSVSMAGNSVFDEAGNAAAQTQFSFSFGGAPTGNVLLAVNVGGGEVDGAGYGLPGVTFESDTAANPHPTVDFSNSTKPGDGNNTNNAGNGDTFTGVNLPDDVFTSERAGNDFSYNVPDLANGTYLVDLYFAETFFGVGTNTQGAGARVFDVAIEGETVLDDYDIFDDGDDTLGNGAGAGLVKIVKTIEATVTDGTLTIRLDTIDDGDGEITANNAKLSAFVVRDVPRNTPDDTVNGVVTAGGDFSDDGLAPTDLGTLEQGVTLISASQQGDDAPGGRERDYFTFNVAQGQELTEIILEDWDTEEIGLPQAFVGLQVGNQVTVDPTTFANVGDLLGGHVYNAADVENPATSQPGNLLSRDALGKGSENGPGGTFTFGDGSGFDAPLPAGTYTLWLNQGGDVSTATLRIKTQAVTVVGTVRIQAEDFDDSDTFAAQALATADGGEVASLPKFGFSGSATYDLSGEVDAGTYTVRIVYYDENDGESVLALDVTSNGAADFSDVVRLDQATNSSQAVSSTLRTQEFTDVEIGTDGQLKIRGFTNGSETASIDYVEFIPQGGNAGPSNGPAQPPAAGPQFGPAAPEDEASQVAFAAAEGPESAIRIEAEDYTANNTYSTQSVAAADGGEVVGLAKFGVSGTATYDLSEQVAPGLYTLRVVYFDENDGKSVISLKVTSDDEADVTKIVRFDESTDSAQSVASTRLAREFVNVEIGSNGELTLSGLTIGSESARVDYFEFIPQSGVLADSGSPAMPVNSAPTSVTFTPTITELAEDADTSAPIKIGDIVIADDGLGDNVITLGGSKNSKFEVVGDELFLKAGATLDFEDIEAFNINIKVDDPTVGTAKFDVATNMSLDIINVNEAPTVSLTPVVTAFDVVSTDTSEPITVATITVSDDTLGTADLILSGADADLFEINGTDLRLKAGTTLDEESNSELDVTVNVDDPTLGGSDVEDSASLTIDVVDSTPTTDVLLRINSFGTEVAVAGPNWLEDTSANPVSFFNGGQNRGDTDATPATPGLAGVPDAIFATARSDNDAFSYDIPISELAGVNVGSNVTVNLYFAEAADAAGFQNPDARVFDVEMEGALALDGFSPIEAFGSGGGGVVSTVVQLTDGTLNLDFIDNGTNNAIVSGIEIIKGGDNPINGGSTPGGAADALAILGLDDGEFDGLVQGVAVDDTNNGGNNGSVVLTVLDGNNNVDASNFNTNAFQLQNTGDKDIAAVFIDIRGAIFKDHVFDIDGTGGDKAAKDFLVQGDDGTGAYFVGANSVSGSPEDNVFFEGDTPLADTSGGSNGAEISGGYRGLLIRFDGSNGGFENGEVVGFSGDGDPNSIAGYAAGLLKPNNVTDGDFDTGGQSGAELAGSSFTVLFADGTTATGYLGSDTTQAGAAGEAVQGRSSNAVTLSVNTGDGTFENGEVGTYGGDLPEITVSGEPGDVVRVTLIKGFRDTNEEAGGSPDLVAEVIQSRLDESHPEFAVNNAFDVQTVDVQIKADGTVTVPASAFDYVDTTSGVTFVGDDVQPLALTASVIVPVSANGAISGSGESDFVPAGPLTEPIYLTNPTETPVDQSGIETPSEGYFEIVGTGANQYFKIQIEDANATGGATPPGKWNFVDEAEVVDTPDGQVTRQAGFQGDGYYVFGDPTETNIDNNIAQTELLEYTIFVPQDAIGTYTFSFRVSRDGQEASDQQNDLWLSFKHAEEEGFGEIGDFLTNLDGNVPEPDNDGFVKIFGGPNDGSWGTTGNVDGDPDNFKADIEITEGGLYTIQVEGRSSGYHVDYLELYKGNNPGNNSDDSAFVEASNGPALAPDVITLRTSIDASTDDFSGLGGAGEDELSFGEDLGQSNTVGLRFDNITIPAGATILEAYLQFEAAENGADAASLTISLEDTDAAATYSDADGPDSRDYLSDEFVWNAVETWDAGDAYQSADFAALIEDLIATNGTLDDAALGLRIEGTGSRVANAFDGDGNAPQLVIVFNEPDSIL